MKPKTIFLILALILLAGLGLRLAHWLAVADEPFFAHLVMDSYEYDRWARTIAAGDWLGSGVFFQAPLYPYLLALAYLAFGRSLALIYLLQIAAAAAGMFALYKAGRTMIGERAGLAAAAMAALYGPFVFYDVQILKESLAVTLVGFLLWALASAWKSGRVRAWLAAGILSGLIALLRENMLLVAPVLGLLALARKAPWRRRAAALAAFLGGGAAVLAPVAVRNGLVGGAFLPTTFQAGANFYIGNNPEADGSYRPIVPGMQMPEFERKEPVRVAEIETGRKLGPAEASRYWTRKALAWARSDPAAFAALQVRKLGLFWGFYEVPDAVDYYYVKEISPALGLPLLEFGSVALLALAGLWLVRKRARALVPVLVFIPAWTAATVIFFVFSRYRLLVVPALLLLASVPVEAAIARVRSRRDAAGLGLVLLAVAVYALPHALRYEPRRDLMEYNAGVILERLGRDAEAEVRYRAALEADPRDFLSCTNLGNIATRRGDDVAAAGWYERAAAIEPRAEGVHVNLGTARLRLGDPARAAEAFDRALAINPRNLEALHDRAVLEAQAGHLEAALEWNRRALAEGPGFEPALRLKAKLERALGKRP